MILKELLLTYMNITGIQKLTLLDFPGYTAATLFTNGCNFMCPFCHNSALVVDSYQNKCLNEEDIFNFLKERYGKLDAICITGGEPLLQKDLIPFISKVKEIGYKVKLDTNGYLFDKLKEIIDLKLVDYVAMDIKNSLNKYSLTAGINTLFTENIVKSINLLKEGRVDYEFRTTIVKELHTLNDIKEISTLLKGSKKYFLQQFEETENNIKQGFHAHSIDTLNEFKNYLLNEEINVQIRGL